MIGSDVVQFISGLNSLPEEKIKYLLGGEGKYRQYMLDDYVEDCIGFFHRNNSALIKLIDEYNTIITDEYFITRGGPPPPVNVNEVIRTITRICRACPIDLLYSMNDGSGMIPFLSFNIAVGVPLASAKNILYEVFMDIYRRTHLECWGKIFEEEK